MMEKLQPKLRFPEFVKDWSNEDIHSILKIGSGRDYKHLNYGNIPVFGTGGLMTYVNDFLYNGETVCIGRKGTIDKPMYYNGPIWTVDTLFYTHSFKNTLPKFIYFCFLNINWKEYNEASGVPSLSKSTIERIIISFPSLPEQQKIASFLTTVDDKIGNLKQKVSLLEKYKKGVMQQIFSQQIRFKDTSAGLSTGTGNDYPDWEEKSLGEVCEFYSGGTPLTTNKNFYNGNIPFIKSGEIGEKETKQFITELGLKNSSAKLVSKGDILYALYGATSGEVSISQINGAINQAVLCIKSSQNQVYLFQYLKYQKDNIVSTYIQGGQGNLSANIIKELNVALPSIKEQTKISEFLSGIDIKIETSKAQLSKMEVWKKGLLQGMFC